MLMNEVPMDALTALAAERERRYTAEAERFRLGRLVRRARRRARTATGAAGTRVTATGHDLCA